MIVRAYNIVTGFVWLVWSLITGRIDWLTYRRLEVCKDCNELSGQWCKDCKCYVPAKARAKASACPKGLWLKVLGAGGGPEGCGLCIIYNPFQTRAHFSDLVPFQA